MHARVSRLLGHEFQEHTLSGVLRPRAGEGVFAAEQWLSRRPKDSGINSKARSECALASSSLPKAVSWIASRD